MGLRDLVFRLVFPERWKREDRAPRRTPGSRPPAKPGAASGERGVDRRYYVRRRR